MILLESIRAFVGWVEQSETQHPHKHPRNVGLKNEIQPTLENLSVDRIRVLNLTWIQSRSIAI
jgi:hypothetical protein